jgi:hypothetical protein
MILERKLKKARVKSLYMKKSRKNLEICRKGQIKFKKSKKYIGEGIRKMKGYICDLKIDELQRLREEFWSKILIKKTLEFKKIQYSKL